MKLKNFLIESAYFPGMLIATWLMVSSCAVHAQITVRQVYDNDSLWVSTTVDSATWASRLVTEEIAPKYGWITDSIKWVVTDTTFEGDCKCEHDWVYGVPDIAGYGFATSSCFVYHPPGQHCDFYNDVREKICRHCLHSEIEREQWYQRFVAPPKSEFELLKEKQNARHR